MASSVPMPGAREAMVLVVGVTGSGKSRFINTLVKDAVKEYAGLHSGTRDCAIVRARIGDNTTVALVDTPGFDDSDRTEADILEEITGFLTAQYQLGIPLKGVVYCHRITDNKMQGSALRNFRLFQKLCGKGAFANVVLLTTMWDKLADRNEGLDRDQQLREDFWSLMEAEGSYIASFDGSTEMAEALVTMLAGKEDIILDIQRELHDERRSLKETSVGQLVVSHSQDDTQRDNKEIEELELRIQEAKRERNAALATAFEVQEGRIRERQKRRELAMENMKLKKIVEETEAKIAQERKTSKWKTGLDVFAHVTGLAISVIFNLLPVFGVGL